MKSRDVLPPTAASDARKAEAWRLVERAQELHPPLLQELLDMAVQGLVRVPCQPDPGIPSTDPGHS